MAQESPSRQGMLGLAVVIGIVVWIVASRSPWESWSRDRFWKLDRAFADPSPIYANGEYHVYTTTSTQCVPGNCPSYWVPDFVSPTLSEPGNLRGDAMPDMPAWVQPDDRQIWAPSVAPIAGTYVMYFAASSVDGVKCLGIAVSTTPEGPFAPQGSPLRCSESAWNIDPYAVTDGAAWFLLWREDDPANPTGKIVGTQLTDDGLGFLGREEFTLWVGHFPWEDGFPDEPGIGPIESPAMVQHPATGEWLLTWSANRWETRDYATGLASCQSPLGPCTPLSIDQPWLRSSSDPSIETGAEFSGCGGMAFVLGPNGNVYATFHAYRGTGPAPQADRVGWVYEVTFDPEKGYRFQEFG
ncbi:MAG TPA: family 43 glycosylhydrolase [Acidimicrobiales bacterium]|jgi:hypothetical protein